MKRTLIHQGNQSFTLTLPVSWVRNHNLKGGEEIDIKEDEGNLVVSTKTSPSLKKTSISIKNMNEKNIRFSLFQLYRRGYSQITLKDVLKDQFPIIENLIDTHFSGVEITNKTKDGCVIEIISEPKQYTFDVMFKKIFYIIQDSLNIIINKEDSSRIKNLTDKTRVYEQFCKRFIANNIRTLDGYEYYAALSYLMVIQSNLNRISKQKVTKINDFTNLQDLFEKTSKNFFEKDLDKLYDTQSKSSELLENLTKTPFYLTECVRIIYSLHSPLIGITLSDYLKKHDNA